MRLACAQRLAQCPRSPSLPSSTPLVFAAIPRSLEQCASQGAARSFPLHTQANRRRLPTFSLLHQFPIVPPHSLPPIPALPHPPGSRARAPCLWACPTRAFSPARQRSRTLLVYSPTWLPSYVRIPHLRSASQRLFPINAPSHGLVSSIYTPPSWSYALDSRWPIQYIPNISRALATRYRTALPCPRSNSIRSLEPFPYVLRPRSICHTPRVTPNTVAPVVLYYLLPSIDTVPCPHLHLLTSSVCLIDSDAPPALADSDASPQPAGSGNAIYCQH
ncbi:hypothetical protein C8Q72DRAFT_834393 [Fomitopsis betulina]|nr:hypothetical protein C8Q72DRAFT_834393 [Fomitopsis betulina]